MKKSPPKIELQTIFALRHGAYDAYSPNKSLDQEGIAQVTTLTERIGGIIAPQSHVLVLSSPTLRAVQSAEIISKRFSVVPKVLKLLEKQDYRFGTAMMREIVEASEGFSVVIAVGHFTAPSGIAHAFAHEALGKSVEPAECKNGDGYIVDLKTGTIITSLVGK
ncbi:MAG: hypothetical protein RLZZ347_561 [Candidatus Parcubacteria bacterium]|jgi:phosphohistidine phosphatase SixA